MSGGEIAAIAIPAAISLIGSMSKSGGSGGGGGGGGSSPLPPMPTSMPFMSGSAGSVLHGMTPGLSPIIAAMMQMSNKNFPIPSSTPPFLPSSAAVPPDLSSIFGGGGSGEAGGIDPTMFM